MKRKLKKLEESYAVIRDKDLFLPPGLAEQFISAQDGYRNISRNKIGRELKSAGVLVIHERDNANTVKPAKGFHRAYHIRLDRLKEVALSEIGGVEFESSPFSSPFGAS